MSEKRPTTPESNPTPETAKHPQPEQLKTKEQDPGKFGAQAEAERSVRKELESLRETKEQDTNLELISEEEQTDPQVRITKDDKHRAFAHAMKHVQSRLPKPSKHFSKLIHNTAVERVSETLDKTIARPSGILGGALSAFFGLGIMSFFARRYGFALSGTELILFVAAGWLAGILIEFVWRKLTRRI